MIDQPLVWLLFFLGRADFDFFVGFEHSDLQMLDDVLALSDVVAP